MSIQSRKSSDAEHLKVFADQDDAQEGAMNSLGAPTARRVKRLAARSVGCIIRLFAEDAAEQTAA